MTISIITGTYNSAKTVEDTLRSVLAQTYKEIDYWVVDGGSKDDTMDIVRKYEPLFGGCPRPHCALLFVKAVSSVLATLRLYACPSVFLCS